MRTATITEAKNQLSALIDSVRGGDSVLILDRGIPVARLERAGRAGDAHGLAGLVRTGVVRLGTGEPSEVLRTPPPTPRNGASAVQAVLDERRDGR
jgi:antitoxin (DNA-binding transcriptional repressor) of toxin-antitoxin stability system